MLTIDGWRFDAAARTLERAGQERRLTPKAASVLSALAETPGGVWSRAAILERVWPCVTVGEEVLTHAISELRRAFGESARGARIIETVHKSGYRLSADALHSINLRAANDNDKSPRRFSARDAAATVLFP